MEQLSQKTINNNSGQDLYDYFFNGIPLKIVFKKDKEDFRRDFAWEEDGIEWLEEQLLDGEEWDFYDAERKFVYTSLYRVANIKKRLWRRTQFAGQMVTVVLDYKGLSVHRLVYKKWGIQMDYDSLPQIVKDNMNSVSYFKKLQKKRKG